MIMRILTVTIRNIAVNTTKKGTYVIELAYVCIDDSEKRGGLNHNHNPINKFQVEKIHTHGHG